MSGFNAGFGRIWILGDSIIHWAGMGNPPLPVVGRVAWLGHRGLLLSRLLHKMEGHLRRERPYPSVMVLHAGTNDVLLHSTVRMRGIIAETLWGNRHTLPNTTIIWSDVIPRHYFHGEINAGAGRRIINFINAQAHGVIFQMNNAHFVRHRSVFPPHHFALYRYDGLHLTNAGNLVFRMNLAEALVYFRANTGSKAFPPEH